jgi:hypothetical protein
MHSINERVNGGKTVGRLLLLVPLVSSPRPLVSSGGVFALEPVCGRGLGPYATREIFHSQSHTSPTLSPFPMSTNTVRIDRLVIFVCHLPVLNYRPVGRDICSCMYVQDGQFRSVQRSPWQTKDIEIPIVDSRDGPLASSCVLKLRMVGEHVCRKMQGLRGHGLRSRPREWSADRGHQNEC